MRYVRHKKKIRKKMASEFGDSYGNRYYYVQECDYGTLKPAQLDKTVTYQVNKYINVQI